MVYFSEDDHYEGTFHRYRRRNEGGGGGNSFGAAEDVFLFNATRTIFVGNIERNTTSSELKRMFERYGDIVVSPMCRIHHNRVMKSFVLPYAIVTIPYSLVGNLKCLRA